MNIEIIKRHDSISQDYKDYALEKAKKVLKYFKNITKVEVLLAKEKDNHSAEMIISVSRGTKLVGKSQHEDMKAAIDLLTDKMERQIVRFKERLKQKRGDKGGAVRTKDSMDLDEELSYDDIINRDYRSGS